MDIRDNTITACDHDWHTHVVATNAPSEQRLACPKCGAIAIHAITSATIRMNWMDA